MVEKKAFKACKNCRALVTPETTVCPVCQSTSFTDEWNGMVIILNQDSEVAKMFGANIPWRYAIIIK
ncbi:MAG: transcription elongation factor subunit Spt4 [Sulfolobaceae archaeon]|jgi:DNA-directed RNA polymerase subunit E"|nr:transcription elongation factor subunit Spt4 [Sulfolobaceae archaeon]PVU68075.1 DNA-binding protein [Sulfolobus sp. SCGC AB-777_G05]